MNRNHKQQKQIILLSDVREIDLRQWQQCWHLGRQGGLLCDPALICWPYRGLRLRAHYICLICRDRATITIVRAFQTHCQRYRHRLCHQIRAVSGFSITLYTLLLGVWISVILCFINISLKQKIYKMHKKSRFLSVEAATVITYVVCTSQCHRHRELCTQCKRLLSNH